LYDVGSREIIEFSCAESKFSRFLIKLLCDVCDSGIRERRETQKRPVFTGKADDLRGKLTVSLHWSKLSRGGLRIEVAADWF
jgi:hypothetical protein